MRYKTLLSTLLVLASMCLTSRGSAEVITLQQATQQALASNPQVRAARYRWESAQHQIIQNYTPADPEFSFTDFDSWRGFLYGSGNHNLTLTQSFQFPGKGLLQGRSARRTAEIASHLPGCDA